MRCGNASADDIIVNMDPSAGPPRPFPQGTLNPYFDGMWPIEMLDNKPDLDSPWGRSEVQALKRVAEAFSRTGHVTTKGVLRRVPQWIADAGGLSPNDIQVLKDMGDLFVERRPGTQVAFDGGGADMPGNISYMQFLIGLTNLLTGMDEGAAAPSKGRQEVRSGVQLEGLQQATQVLVRATARRLEKFLERVGQKWISRIFQFYQTDRLMNFTTSQGVQQYKFEREKLKREVLAQALRAKMDATQAENMELVLKGRPLLPFPPQLDTEDIRLAMRGAWRDFRFRIVPYSSLSTTRAARAQVLAQLASEGQIPMSKVVEEAGFENTQDLVKEVAAEQQFRASVGLPPPGPPPGKKGKK
jgi:hypothetical protein